MSCMEFIGPGDHIRRDEESAKQAKKSAAKITDLHPDVVETIFEISNCQERSRLCKTNREFAKLCRTESHKEKCNPKSAEARDVREDFESVKREIKKKVRQYWNEHGYRNIDFINGAFGLEIYDPQKFANFLDADENWSLVHNLLRLFFEAPSMTFRVKIQGSSVTDFYNHQRFKMFMGFVSSVTSSADFWTRTPSLSDISFFLKSVNPAIVTQLDFGSDTPVGKTDRDVRRNIPQHLKIMQNLQNLQNLKVLKLRNLLIGDEDLGFKNELHMPKLEHLDLGGNKISFLNLRGMMNLESLNLNDNQFSDLDLTKNVHLRILNLSKNKITKLLLPPKIEGPFYNRERDGIIKFWDLSHNLLTELPKNFWKIFDTNKVRLQHNRLEALHFDAFPPKSRIQHFYINGNKLRSLPESFIHWVKRNTNGVRYACETIDLRDNDLPLACYPQARNIIADMKTMSALMNDPEKRENYLDLWLYDKDTYLGKFEFSWEGHIGGRHDMRF